MNPMRVTVHGQFYLIKFDYSTDNVDFVKRLQGAGYRQQLGAWVASRTLPNALDLKEHNVYRDDETLSLMEDPKKLKVISDDKWIFNCKFFDHQVKWAAWCASRPKAMLVAEMGLGKTLMAMQWLNAHNVNPNDVLVVCPNSLKRHWAKEFKQWCGVEAHPVEGTAKQRQRTLSFKGVHVVNYEFCVGKANSLRDELAKIDKKVFLYDESHFLKSPSSKRSKIIQKWMLGKSHVLMLTGTPISQGAQDYYSQFKVLNPRLLGNSYSAFKARYCIEEAIRGAPPGIKRITGYRLMNELTRIITPYTHTLLKRDCLDLPEKMYSTRFVTMTPTQRKMYRDMKRDMMLEFSNGSIITAPNVLTRMLRLSQITQGYVSDGVSGVSSVLDENPKLDMLETIIDDLPPSDSCIIICRFIKDIELIKELLTKKKETFAIIQGSVDASMRQGIADNFQSGKFRFLVGEIRTTGVGLTLTKSSRMIFYSNNYSLVDRLQAEDRIHRIGAVGDSCQYIDIVAEDTIDEQVVAALKNKQDVASALTEMRLDICKE